MVVKRIVISANTVWNIANFREGLVSALLAEGFEVLVVAPNDAYVETIQQLGCKHIDIKIDNKGTSLVNDLKLIKSYYSILKREQPDVFLGYTIKPNVYGSMAAHQLGIPVINNISGLGTAFIKKNWLTKVVRLLYKLALRKSVTVFFQNKDDEKLFIESNLVKEQQTKLLPGSGINLDKYKAKSLSQKKSNKETEFLLIARLLYDKGVQEFIDAARMLKSQNQPVKCSLLGFLGVENVTSIPQEALQAYIDEGVINYYGSCDDIRPYIEASDCVVLPSYREGLPRSLLEGAAMSRPLIATDVPGCRDIVEDGKNGHLCKVKSADDLAAKMKKFQNLTQTQKAKMGDASRLKAEQEFDEKIVIERYLSVIKQAIEVN